MPPSQPSSWDAADDTADLPGQRKHTEALHAFLQAPPWLQTAPSDSPDTQLAGQEPKMTKTAPWTPRTAKNSPSLWSISELGHHLGHAW